MAKLILRTYSAERVGSFVQIEITGDSPFPRREIEVKTAADCQNALEAYAEEARATGLGLHVSMMLARGERAPRGFKALPGDLNVNL